MGNSLVAENPSSISQQQVPLVTCSTPPGYTGPTQKSSAFSLNCLQPLPNHQKKRGPLLDTIPTGSCLHVGGRPDHSDPTTLVALRDGVSMVMNRLDGQGLGRPVDECPLTTVGPVAHAPLDESTHLGPQMPSPDPHPMLDLHRAAFGGMAGEPIPGVGVPNTTHEGVLSSSHSPVLSFGLAPCATHSHWKAMGWWGATGGQHGHMVTYFPAIQCTGYAHSGNTHTALHWYHPGLQPWCRVMQLRSLHCKCLARVHLAWWHGWVVRADDAPV